MNMNLGKLRDSGRQRSLVGYLPIIDYLSITSSLINAIWNQAQLLGLVCNIWAEPWFALYFVYLHHLWSFVAGEIKNQILRQP